MTKSDTVIRNVLLLGLGVSILGMSGCADISYAYDIPKDESDCPDHMTYRDGGTGIVDRDDGTDIVDRDGNIVTAHCEEATCPSGQWSNVDPAVIDWHQHKGEYVIANRICLAVTK